MKKKVIANKPTNNMQTKQYLRKLKDDIAIGSQDTVNLIRGYSKENLPGSFLFVKFCVDAREKALRTRKTEDQEAANKIDHDCISFLTPLTQSDTPYQFESTWDNKLEAFKVNNRSEIYMDFLELLGLMFSIHMVIKYNLKDQLPDIKTVVNDQILKPDRIGKLASALAQNGSGKNVSAVNKLLSNVKDHLESIRTLETLEATSKKQRTSFTSLT